MATDFLFSFISVLSISCFLIFFFFFPCFLCLVLSFTSFVIDLICLYFLLPAIINYLCVPLSMFVSILSCRFCFIFLCERFFVSNLFFFLLCSVVFSPPFFFFYLTVFLHLSFISFVGSFLIRFFSIYFPFMYLLVFPFLCSFLSFPQKCLFMLVSFLPFSFCFDLFQQNISFLLFHSHCFQHFQKQIPFSMDI